MECNSSFKAAWWLSNPHLQTLYSSYARSSLKPNHYYRERLITADNDFIDLDWCAEKNNKPLIILLHGLTGSSQSSYILGMQKAFANNGWRSVALNFRGCSGTPNNLARSYHSGNTEDINFLFHTLREREPDTMISAVGFSLGGNVLLKWLGEQADNISLASAVAVSVPLQLDICANKLENGFSKIYRKHLISNLIAYMQNKQAHLEACGYSDEANKISQLGNLQAIKSFWEYDDQVVAKLNNFKDVHEYYKLSSSRQYLKKIKLPTKIIQSRDDPFMTEKVLPTEKELSPFVEMEITNTGGHVGFISGHNPFRPIFWLESCITDFFKQQFKSIEKDETVSK